MQPSAAATPGFVLEQIAEDCDDFCVISASPTGVPWHMQGKNKGKTAAARYFETLAATVDHTFFEARDFAVDRRPRLRHRPA